VHLLTVWQVAVAEAELVEGEATEVLVLLILRELEHIEKVLPLVEFMLHLLSLQIIRLHQALLEIEVSLHLLSLILLGVVLGLFKEDLVLLGAYHLANCHDLLLLINKLLLVKIKVSPLLLHLFSIRSEQFLLLVKEAVLLLQV